MWNRRTDGDVDSDLTGIDSFLKFAGSSSRLGENSRSVAVYIETGKLFIGGQREKTHICCY